jgi:hypothetical protein
MQKCRAKLIFWSQTSMFWLFFAQFERAGSHTEHCWGCYNNNKIKRTTISHTDLGAHVVEHQCITNFVRTEAISKKAIDEKSNSSSTILQLSRKHAYSFNRHRQENQVCQAEVSTGPPNSSNSRSCDNKG